MQSTAMVEALSKLRATFDNPPSDMEIIRRTLSRRAAGLTEIEMPPILNSAQRKVFLDNLDMVSAFLETEDGADSVELLVNAFSTFSAERDAPDGPKAAVVPVEDGPD